MNGSANVQTFDAIHAVRAAVVSFGDQVEQALSMVDIEMRRVLDWLEHDRPRYWRTQVRVAQDDVNEARAALHRCLMFPVADERPSCYEERAALKKAQAHLAYCEDKSERLKHWVREVRHEMFEYEGRISQLTEIVEFDVPQAVGILAKLIARLEEYEAIRQSGGTGEAASAAGASFANELWSEKQSTPTDPETKSESNANDPDPKRPGLETPSPKPSPKGRGLSEEGP